MKSIRRKSVVGKFHGGSLSPSLPASPRESNWRQHVRSAADGWCVTGTAGRIWHAGVGPVPASCPAAARYLWPRDERGEEHSKGGNHAGGSEGKAANHKNLWGWITLPVRARRVLGLHVVAAALQIG